MEISKRIIWLILLLIGSALAGRLDDVARRKGFHPNAVRDLERRAQGVGHEAATSRRYYSESSKGKHATHLQ